MSKMVQMQSEFWDNMGDVFGYDIIGSESHPLKKAFELYCEMMKEQDTDDEDDKDEEEEEEEEECTNENRCEDCTHCLRTRVCDMCECVGGCYDDCIYLKD